MEFENKNLSGLWGFFEANLPNYYRRDDVLRSDILFRYYTNDSVCGDDLEWINDEFDGDMEAVKQELVRLETQFARESIENFYEKISKENFAD